MVRLAWRRRRSWTNSNFQQTLEWVPEVISFPSRVFLGNGTAFHDEYKIIIVMVYWWWTIRRTNRETTRLKKNDGRRIMRRALKSTSILLKMLNYLISNNSIWDKFSSHPWKCKIKQNSECHFIKITVELDVRCLAALCASSCIYKWLRVEMHEH